MTMRRWHRWLTVLFGVFILWTAATGVASQIVPLFQKRGEAARPAGPPVPAEPGLASPPESGATAPAAAEPRPRRPSLVGTLHHLHSGETFGPVGVAISILSGIALMFFAVSGMWMYLQMWLNRKRRGSKSGVFWN